MLPPTGISVIQLTSLHCMSFVGELTLPVSRQRELPAHTKILINIDMEPLHHQMQWECRPGLFEYLKTRQRSTTTIFLEHKILWVTIVGTTTLATTIFEGP
ncbi:hypothetical protein O6H91_02G088400 [Diphasiastrum complanatum]|uniref:Uncharacterized protein n=1 Tax=Diphasiastrum complanatum TaxID=34168 RepID=A0ACC2EI64_DIPCM|nr:hypothetical protein O6H91_02G088400 [Diphasiastrum complanatum]